MGNGIIDEILIFSHDLECFDNNSSIRMEYIQDIIDKIKLERDNPIYKQSIQIPQILTKTLFLINKRKEKSPSIFLIIPPQYNCSPQYKGMMNCMFRFRDQKIPVDILSLYREEGIFQQLSYMSGGVYLSPKGNQICSLMEYIFGIDPSIRKTLSLPEPPSIDLRPDCFCHGKPLSEGFVCSVCLGIFCKFIPICPICRSKFDFKNRLKK